MLFASKHAFEFTITSRRDDLISLCYILIYLLDESHFKFINQVVGLSKKDKFKYIKNSKLSMSPLDLCGTKQRSPISNKFLEFVEEVMQLQFKDTPDYNKLRFLLKKTLLSSNQVPNKIYDWTPSQMLVSL